MGDSNCALDGCRRPPLGNSLYCGFHRSRQNSIKKKELTAAAETIFPTSGKYRLISCRISRFIGREDVARIRYVVKPAEFGGYNPYSGKYKSSYYFEAETDTIEINEINLKDLSQIKAEMRRALANLQRADEAERRRMRKEAERMRELRSSRPSGGSAGRGSSSRQNRWLPSNDDDINSVDGGPPSEAYDAASDDDG